MHHLTEWGTSRFRLNQKAPQYMNSKIFPYMRVQITTGPTPFVAPSNLTYTNTYTIATVNTPITINYPYTHGDAVTHYESHPSLPTGLLLNEVSGVISGTATVIMEETAFMITASNSAGSTTTGVYVTVNDLPPSNLMYDPSLVFITQPNTHPIQFYPTNAGGQIINYVINPSLIEGLLLNSSTGIISGTPINVGTDTRSIGYTVTGSNSGGSTAAAVIISIVGDDNPCCIQ